jgi:hypothetical protein
VVASTSKPPSRPCECPENLDISTRTVDQTRCSKYRSGTSPLGTAVPGGSRVCARAWCIATVQPADIPGEEARIIPRIRPRKEPRDGEHQIGQKGRS